MSSERRLLSIRMVIIPLPPALRFRSTTKQFPTLNVYETSVHILGEKLAFTEITDLKLTEEGGIRFNSAGISYHYAAISHTSKETPNPDLTAALFRLLTALKSGEAEKVSQVLAELKGTRKAMTKSTVIMAMMLIVICALLTYLEEFGCKKVHNKMPETTIPKH